MMTASGPVMMAAAAPKKANSSAWSQYQREWYASHPAAEGQKHDMALCRTQLSADWKAVKAGADWTNQQAALKARCDAHNVQKSAGSIA